MTGQAPLPVSVSRYLDALGAFDFDGLATTLAPEVVRTGPWGDVISGREAYAAFLARVVPELPGYRLIVHRVAAAGPGLAVAEITERIVGDGGPLDTAEALVFDLDSDGLISAVGVYLRPPAAEAPPGALP